MATLRSSRSRNARDAGALRTTRTARLLPSPVIRPAKSDSQRRNLDGRTGNDERILQRAAPAALRLRAGQPAEGERARRRRRHHRPRHGQSRPADAGAHRREARRDRAPRRHPRLLGLARHQRAPQGAGRLLRPPLRREARPEHPGHRHHRLQGRLRQHGAGDHRAGRRGALPEPELPDPRLRLPDGGRRDPLAAGGARRRTISTRSSGR